MLLTEKCPVSTLKISCQLPNSSTDNFFLTLAPKSIADRKVSCEWIKCYYWHDIFLSMTTCYYWQEVLLSISQRSIADRKISSQAFINQYFFATDRKKSCQISKRTGMNGWAFLLLTRIFFVNDAERTNNLRKMTKFIDWQ